MSSQQAQLAVIAHFRLGQEYGSVASFMTSGLFGGLWVKEVKAADQASMRELLVASGFLQYDNFPQLTNQVPLYIEYSKDKGFDHATSQVDLRLTVNN